MNKYRVQVNRLIEVSETVIIEVEAVNPEQAEGMASSYARAGLGEILYDDREVTCVMIEGIDKEN